MSKRIAITVYGLYDYEPYEPCYYLSHHMTKEGAERAQKRAIAKEWKGLRELFAEELKSGSMSREEWHDRLQTRFQIHDIEVLA